MEKKKAILGALSVVVLLGVTGGTWWFFRDTTPPAPAELETAAEVPAPPAVAAADKADTLEEIDRAVGTFGQYEMRLHRSIVDIGGAHPEVNSWYEVVDVPGKRAVKLNEFFPEKSVIAAVTAAIHDDDYSSDKESAASYQELKAATTQMGMKQALTKLGSELFFNTEQCEEVIQIDLATDNFAIVAFDPTSGKADVHLGVFSPTHLCKSTFPRVRLTIDVPTSLRPDLEAAASKKKGSLPVVDALRVCETCDPVDVAKLGLMGG